MTTELCDICGVNLCSSLCVMEKPTHLIISKKPPYKDAVEMTLCGRCHNALIDSIAKESRKEWKQEAKQKLRELFP